MVSIVIKLTLNSRYIQPCVVNQYLTIAQEQAIVNGLNWLLDKDYVDLDAIRRGKRRYYSIKLFCMLN